MATKKTFKRIDSAFTILFALLIAFVMLHATTVTRMSEARSPAALQMAAELERFRYLEADLRNASDHLRDQTMDRSAKVAILNTELERIENTLRDLGSSGLRIAGLTRLVEPYMHVRDARSKMLSHADDVDAVLAAGGPLDRALQASLFVVRNNVIRFGHEVSAVSASMNESANRSRHIAVIGGLAAILIFAPIRLTAGRAAAKEIRQLKAATNAVAQERWNVARIDCNSDDAVGELVGAFNTMADKLRESREQRAGAFHRTLASLVQTIEAKDAFTCNHSRNVSKLAEMLARALKRPDGEVKEIIYGALLHDIGKIGISDQIINKPGKLTPEEFNAVEEHPVIGDRIVRPLDGADALLGPVRHHHEHWDGTGYPDGLRGEHIPLTARIITVADVFEALISDRPYRDRMPVEQAVAVLRSEAGKTLDPKLVRTFVSEVLPKVEPLLQERLRQIPSDSSRPVERTADEKLHPLLDTP